METIKIRLKIIKFLIFTFLSFFCFSQELENKIIICGVIKNGEKGFLNVKRSVQKLSQHLLDYRVIIYENNSIDATKELYLDWAKTEKKLIFIHENLSKEFLENFTVKKGDYRTELIARARNIVLKKALNQEFDSYPYLLMVDLDDFDEWNIDEILNSIKNPEKDWDAIFANGSYDLYALRSKEFLLSAEILGWNLWCAFQPYIGLKLKKILASKRWYPVESAFGGLAIYRREAIKGCIYKGLLDSNYIKKMENSDYTQDFIFKKNKNTKKVIVRAISKLLEWEKSNYNLSFAPDSIYISEHIIFHHQMIENGYDRLFINPSLTHPSKVHRNY